MKSAPAALITHLAQPATTLAACVKIKRRDGTIIGLTDHDLPLTINVSDGDGSIVYEASPGLILTAVSAANDLRADQLEITGATDATAITAADLRAGKYDDAEFKSFLVNWASVGSGIIKLGRYKWGEVRTEEARYRVEMRSLMDALAQPILELFSVDCRAALGDDRCNVQLAPPTWSGAASVGVRPTRDGKAPTTGSPLDINTVKPTTQNGFYYRATVGGATGATEPTWPTTLDATVVDGTATWLAIRAYRQRGTVTSVSEAQRVFRASGISDPSGVSPTQTQWWGQIAWLTGNNSGLTREIRLDDGGGGIWLRELAELTIQVGDTFEVTVRCDKLRATCRDTFDNMNNRRAEDDTPSMRTAFTLPPPSIPDLIA